MASLSIRRGTTKTFLFTIDEQASKDFDDLGKLLLRITQDGGPTFDRELEVNELNKKQASVSFSQEETIRFKEGKKFSYQLFSIIGPEPTEVAAKSDIHTGSVLPSLWNEVIHNE